MGKSNKYPHSMKGRIYLLFYITHWAFILSETVVALLQYWRAHKENKFEVIFCYSPIDKENGVTHLIYPTPPELWAGFDPEQFKENVVQNLSPVNWHFSNS
jgi:hypothetical protein